MTFDPVLDAYLSVDGEGRIRGIENPSVSEALPENGSFFWSGPVHDARRLTASLLP
ncbi:MAG: hypothetical protein LBP80_06345 [Treponema sp.]|nr:hypothetical protein [Treponema sp.]